MNVPTVEDAFRPLRDWERQTIVRLLGTPFPGSDELMAQVEVVQARAIDDEGSIALRVDGGRPAVVQQRVPVQGLTHDPDGMSVTILLHVVDGFMNELDVFRGDSAPRPVPLDPASIELVVRSGTA